MSIKGIDTQIMISRLTDSVRDVSAMQKRPEVAQDALAYRGRINDAEVQSKVAKTTESEMEKVRTDVDEGGNSDYGGAGGSDPHEDEQEDEFGPDMIVPPGNYTIDIMI